MVICFYKKRKVWGKMSKRYKFKQGDVVMQEGSTSSCAFIIESGKIELSSMNKGERTVHSVLSNNQTFGTMGLITDKQRPYTATAMEETIVKVVVRDEFNEFFTKNNGDVEVLIVSLIDKLRTFDKRVEFKETTEQIKKPDSNKIKRAFMLNGSSDKNKMVDNRSLLMYGGNDVTIDALSGQNVPINKFPFRVGRETNTRRQVLNKAGVTCKETVSRKSLLDNNDLCIVEDDKPYYVAANHFLIDKVNDNFVLTDLGSRLGVNQNQQLL